jgi:hypothetical protein
MHELIDKVLQQMKKDVESGDVTSIEELLRHTPEVALTGYLPEEFTATLSADDEAFAEAYQRCFSASSFDIECLLDFLHDRPNPDMDGIIVDAYHLWNAALTHSTKEK